MGERTCSVEGCERSYHAKGFCSMHWKRIVRNGDPGSVGASRNPQGPTCSIEGCERDTVAFGWCFMHYKRARKSGGDPGPAESRFLRGRICSVGGCGREARGRGLCHTHYSRWRKTGTTDDPRDRARSYRTPEGYVLLPISKHDPLYSMAVRKKRYVFEHRLVMARHIGRPLLPEESVHHINGVRDDNRLENLELWSSSHPSGQRVADKVKWAREILALYGEEYDE
jgi:hypothetical protein